MPGQRDCRTVLAHRLGLALAVLTVCAAAAPFPARDRTTKSHEVSVSSQQGRKAVERGLAFLQQDAATWRKERQCATCHHGTMTVWALTEAKSRGYAVKPETLADVTAWTKERLKGIDKPRDTRPGRRMVNTPARYLAMLAQAVPKQDAVRAG